MQHYLLTLSKFADFKSRTGRTEFWMFTLFNFLAFIICLIIDNIFGITFGSLMEAMAGLPKEQLPYGVFYMLYSLLTLVPSLAVGVRRLHDIGKSGWFSLLGFIPLVGAIILIVWFCKEGQKEANQWGENPLNPTETIKPSNKIPIIMGSLLLGLGIIFGGVIFGMRKYLENNVSAYTNALSEEELSEENLSDYSSEEETNIEPLDISEIEQMVKDDFEKRKYSLIRNPELNEDETLESTYYVTINEILVKDLSGDGLEDVVILYDVTAPSYVKFVISTGVLLYENTGNGIRFHKKADTEEAMYGAGVNIRNGKVILYWDTVNTGMYPDEPQVVKSMEVEY